MLVRRQERVRAGWKKSFERSPGLATNWQADIRVLGNALLGSVRLVILVRGLGSGVQSFQRKALDPHNDPRELDRIYRALLMLDDFLPGCMLVDPDSPLPPCCASG